MGRTGSALAVLGRRPVNASPTDKKPNAKRFRGRVGPERRCPDSPLGELAGTLYGMPTMER
jgi:hypothetical protein